MTQKTLRRALFCDRVHCLPVPPTPSGDRTEQAFFYGHRNMTKAEHKQRAVDLAYQVKHCYSKTAKRKMIQECLDSLRKSLKGI